MTYKIYNPDNVSFITGIELYSGERIELNIPAKGWQTVEDCGEEINKKFAHLEVSPCDEKDAKVIVASHKEYLENFERESHLREKQAKESSIKDAEKAVEVHKRILAEKQAIQDEAEVNFKKLFRPRSQSRLSPRKEMKMKNRMFKRAKPFIGFVAVIVVLAISLITVIHAEQAGTVIQNIENAVFQGTVSSSPGSSGDVSGHDTLGGTSHFTSDAVFSGTVTHQTTTTLQEVTLGTRFSKALNFTAGATGTPGGLFSLQNTGSNKLCLDPPVIMLTSNTNGTMAYSVATSTLSNGYNNDIGASLIASTTAATATAPIIQVKGRSNMNWFSWPNGTYILGAFTPVSLDGGTSRANASSSDYTTNTGTFNVFCVSQ